MASYAGKLAVRAWADLAAGRLAEAESQLRRALEIDPRDPDALHGMGAVARRRGDDRAAADLLSRASHGRLTNRAGMLLEIASTLLSLRALPQAGAAIDEYLRLKPNDAGGHNLRGVIAMESGRLNVAREAMHAALRLHPNDARALANLGAIAAREGNVDEAIDASRAALAAAPGELTILNNLGMAHAARGELHEAVGAYRQVLAARPTRASAWHNLAIALEELGQCPEAVEAARRASDPASGGMAGLVGNWLLMLTRSPNHAPEDVAAAHREFGLRHDRPTAAPHQNDRSPDRVLRVGYVSADFRSHAAAPFYGPLLERHDRSAVHVTCYSSTAVPDPVTQRIRHFADAWRDIRAASDEAAANLIRRDQIDVLVDLTGHTEGGRLSLFGLRPAPVQVTYLGYANTTGLTSIGYRITDAVADPPGTTESLYTEQLVHLPRLAWAYGWPADAPDVSPLPADCRGGAVTFGSFHPVARLTEPVLALWARILNAAPSGSRLLIVRDRLIGDIRTRIAETLARHGADLNRVDLSSDVPANHLELYQQADIQLDTFPWSGHTTACQSLYMGVPVVTLAGRTHASRMVASVLTAVGLGELVATSEADYVRIAAELARDTGRLRVMRAGLRERVLASPLSDSAGFARELESAYRAMWTAWRDEGRAAAS